MRRRAVLSLIAVLSLGACAHQPAPSALPGMSWSLMNVEGEGAKLAFGAPNSDNVALMLVCEPGSGRVEVYGPSAETSVELTAADPALAAFARTGEARFRQDLRAPAAPRETAARFVASCRA